MKNARERKKSFKQHKKIYMTTKPQNNMKRGETKTKGKKT